MARFAPSPTGPLHLGSLLAAVGSYLDARAHGARWLVRIEDLDTPRVVPGCADEQLRTLEAFGFEWDGEVLYQSTRREAYRAALDSLDAAGRLFACSCSRRELAAGGEESPGYPGTCRAGPTRPGRTARRFRVSDRPIHFDDLYQGSQDFDLTTCGDVVVERRDGLASYQLAVVVDDAFQGVTRVVRGADLLSSTPWQLDLQACAVIATSYLRAPAAAGGTGRHQTIQVETVGAARPLTSGQRAYDDPYAFVPDATPGIGPFIHKRGVELGIYALAPTSACGHRRGALSVGGDMTAEIATEIVRLRQMH